MIDLSQGKYSGVAIPLGAIRTANSQGIGDFFDLIEFAKWAKKTEFSLIQLLPIQDSGDFSAPYSAVSANGLNPVYISLWQVPLSDNLKLQVQEFSDLHKNDQRIHYKDVYTFKHSILRQVYGEFDIQKSDFQEFCEEHCYWLFPYCAYCTLKELHHKKPWYEWPQMKNVSAADLETVREKNSQNFYYHAFLQFLAFSQFADAATQIKAMDVVLKGDIPILMNLDSADVWYFRKYFNLNFKAGAPPDMFSDTGQNWGFPVYDWENLSHDDYAWWRNRIQVAAQFYGAYRIDHVLGFLRIWQIPAGEYSGLLGFYSPASYIDRHELLALGFDEGRIAWLSTSHISGESIEHSLQKNSSSVYDYLHQIENQNLYQIKPEFRSSETIAAESCPQEVKDFLINAHQNRTLLETSPGVFTAFWFFDQTSAWESLSQDEKEKLKKLIHDKVIASEKLWEKNGEKLLRVLMQSSSMLVCAEDLGAVPACMPGLLNRLQILSLKIRRWARDYDNGGQVIDPQTYPRLSVATLSVHDTSSLRGWWDEESDKEAFVAQLQQEFKDFDEMNTGLATAFLKNLFQANSVLVIPTLQDLFALDTSMLRQSPLEERVNVPGTVNDENWSWRMPFLVKELYLQENWNSTVRSFALRK
ncbi:MAG: 4-alpha-glucanotransferase [Leptospiraceae bacterium]|nr:4-alpha-glucanotransferase [Leptospiraceae bacterium]